MLVTRKPYACLQNAIRGSPGLCYFLWGMLHMVSINNDSEY